MNLLSKLYERHNEWIKMAESFGVDDYAEDIVMEMYCKLNHYVKNPARIMFNEKEVNTMYVYITIRNLCVDLMRARNKVIKYGEEHLDKLAQIIADTPYQIEIDEQIELMLQAMEEEVKDWSWYDAKIWQIYHTRNYSIRQLSSETKISVSSIFNTLKNGKKKIINRIEENRN
jgi:DNA-directed RNA polymerase specialized sigma24 family protein